MKRGRMVLILLLVMILAALWLVSWATQQRREEQARSEYYTTILAQAPCLENICPGFVGRDRALEYLSHSSIVEGKAQGNAIVNLWFTNHNTVANVGFGGLYFSIDSLGKPKAVRRVYLRLHNLNLETVLDALGEPDRFLFIAGCGMGHRVHAKLFYLNRGVEIVIDYIARRSTSEVLTSKTPIDSIEYFASADFEEHSIESLNWYILDSVAYDLHSSVTAEDFQQQIQSWPGIEAAPTPSADFCPR